VHSHVRQWDTQRQCAAELAKLRNEQEGGKKSANENAKDSKARKGLLYDVVLRVRDDLSILQPLHIHQMRSAYKGAMITLDCHAWNGLNDKIIIADGALLEPLFNGPIEYYTDKRKFDSVWAKAKQAQINIVNPEVRI
jgi:hypothetical protein